MSCPLPTRRSSFVEKIEFQRVSLWMTAGETTKRLEPSGRKRRFLQTIVRISHVYLKNNVEPFRTEYCMIKSVFEKILLFQGSIDS